MREILFRGKTYDGKWEQGDLRHGGYVYDDSETYIMRSDYALHNIPVDPKTVGEYTGMTDKNGKKIFEGDIISFTINAFGYVTSRIGEVYYSENYPVFFIKTTTGRRYNFSAIEDIKVIGNIHDNPELLKGKDNEI